MKKKLFLLLFIFGFFFYMPNVFADSFYVCSDGCDYSTLDDALTAAENMNNESYIYLYDNDSYTITSHTINSPVYITVDNEEEGSITINGNDATIQSNYQISFYNSNGNHSLRIENVNFLSDYFYGYYFVFIEYFNDVDVYNVSVKADDCDEEWPIGLDLDENYGTNLLDSITIEGFYKGFETEDSSATIQNSVLSNNLFSIYAYDQEVKVINTELSFVNLRYGASIEVDGLWDKTIIMEEEISFSSDEEWEQWINSLKNMHDNKVYEDYLLIYYYFGMGSSLFKKDMTINDNSFNLLDAWFYDHDYELTDFDIENLDDEVVSIENGVVKPLKGGKSTIILTDKNTGHEYRLNVNVDYPTIINPKTGNTFWLDFIVVVFIFSVLGGYVYKKQH